ncbi:E3 ubiquitin-protein ligase ATL6 [Cardamine amara subsp. amara]|uniref:RING-type E3 ubiquitin transferase n=1 Tax=Cardamine amara subsp. amara TaxID=228776 RepID=A0ABD1BG57_CARAN
MNDYDKVLSGCFIIAVIIVLIISCCTSPTVLVLPPETIQQTPQPQQDSETGHMQVLMFKDLNEEEEEGNGKSSCPICLEEYEDDHEITRLKKCRHVFHRFCIDSWLTHAPSCPSCRRSVDLMSLGL